MAEAETKEAPSVHPLIREYRRSMDRDALHDWAGDAVAKMRADDATKADLLAALKSAVGYVEDRLHRIDGELDGSVATDLARIDAAIQRAEA